MYDLNDVQNKINSSYNELESSFKYQPKEEKSDLFYQPFIKPINLLKSLDSLKLPLEKMLLIANLSIGVTNSVNEFWSEMKSHFDTSLLDINADELMAIFIYIIMKSQKPEIIIHLNIIKEFTTAVTRNSMMGYYYTTIEAAIIFIKNLKSFDDLSELKESHN